MSHPLRFPLHAVTAAAMAFSGAASAASGTSNPGPGTRLGTPFVLNGASTLLEQAPRLVADADGSFAVAYRASSNLACAGSLYLRHVDEFATGGTAVLVSNVPTWDHALVQDADGNQLLAWTRVPTADACTSTPGYAKLVFRPYYRGAPSAETGLSTTTNMLHRCPSVAMAGDRRVLVTWRATPIDPPADPPGYHIERGTVRYRTVDPNGAPHGGENILNGTTPAGCPAIGMDGAGNGLIVWPRLSHQTTTIGSYSSFLLAGQRMGTTGSPVGSPFLIDTPESTGCSLLAPAVAVNADGSFVVAWEHQCGSLFSLTSDIRARRFNAAGTPLSATIPVSPTGHVEREPSVSADHLKGFVVTWSEDDTTIHARHFTPAGAAGSISRVDGGTPGAHFSPSVALDADGDIITGWTENPDNGTGVSVMGQRFRGTEPVDVTATIAAPPVAATTGETVAYATTVENLHPSTADADVGVATGVTAKLTAGGGQITSVRALGWTCDAGTPVRTCTRPDLGPGVFTPIRVSATRTTAGTLSFSVKVSANQYDPTPANNGDTEVTTFKDPVDTTPDPFDFPDRLDLPVSQYAVSAILVPTGYDTATSVALTCDGTSSYRLDGGTWVSEPGTIAPGQSLQLRVKAATTPATTRTCMVDVGGVTDTYAVTTAP